MFMCIQARFVSFSRVVSSFIQAILANLNRVLLNNLGMCHLIIERVFIVFIKYVLKLLFWSN
jgi:hypothetical protein